MKNSSSFFKTDEKLHILIMIVESFSTTKVCEFAKKFLNIDGNEFPFPGHGLFKKSHKDLTLTKYKSTRSRWQLPKKYFQELKA